MVGLGNQDDIARLQWDVVLLDAVVVEGTEVELDELLLALRGAPDHGRVEEVALDALADDGPARPVEQIEQPVPLMPLVDARGPDVARHEDAVPGIGHADVVTGT